MKRVKQFLSMLLCVILVASSVPITTASAAAVNVARGKPVTATDSMAGGGLYAPDYLTDGVYGNYPADQHLGWCVSASESATIDLQGTFRISQVNLVPVTFESGKFFPSAYTVFISSDGESWTEVGGASVVPDVGATPQQVKFEEVEASYVKIDVTPRDVVETNGSTSTYAQLGEVEVFGDKVEKPVEVVNAARGALVTATDSMAGGGLYAPDYLTDGVYGNYPVDQHLGWCVGASESATIYLDGFYSISRVDLVPVTFESGKFFPSAYTVSVSSDGQKWTKVGGAENVPEVGTTPQKVLFDEVKASYIKIDVTPRDVVETNGSTSTYAQLGEVEVFGYETNPPTPGEDTTLDLHAYALEGYQNLALHKEGVTASDDNAHFGKAAKNVTDGILENTGSFGWDTYGSHGIAWLQIDLDGVCDIERVVVYPFWTASAVGEYFPAEYDLQVSLDGKEFTTVDTFSNPNRSQPIEGAVIHDFPETQARYVRINVTTANPKLMVEYGNDARPHSQIGEVNVYGFSRDLKAYDPYIPYKSVYTNLALGQKAEATEDNLDGGMAAVNTTDGLLTKDAPYGWSTNQSTDPATGVEDLTIALKGPAVLSRFVVYPFYIGEDAGVYFPRAYELQLSSNGKDFTTVATREGNQDVTRPQVIDLAETVEAQYIRLHVTSGGYNAADANPYCTQIGEVSAYGIYSAEASSINKTALRMIPGDKDFLKVAYYGIGEPRVSYQSANPEIATVTAEGRVDAVSMGTTTITVTEAVSGAVYEVSVLVDDYVATDNLMITAFWPIQNYNMNDDYLDKMKEVGITNIQLNYVLNTANYADNMTIAQMAYERGMGVTVSEKDWGWGKISEFSDEQIYQEALKYSHVPGVIGYYIIDEPADASPFGHCFAPIKEAMPTADVHLNFVYNQANCISLLEQVGQNLDYLMWDAYIYPNQGCNEAALFKTSNDGRLLALEYGVKTAQFIQSCGFNGTNRKPNGNEIRYNVNAALAYGNKQIAYFTYRIPEGVGETFTSAIVNADGSKTEIFDDVAKINAAALELGPTLMGVEALEVYHTGKDSGANNPLPKDFFLQPKAGPDLIVSYMRNNDTKQNYVMLVNRNYEASTPVEFTMAEGISSMRYIDDKTGASEALAGNGQDYNVTLQPGGAILLELDPSFDWMPNYGEFIETPAGQNAAQAKKTSLTAIGENAGQLTDGARILNTYTDGCALPGFTANLTDSLNLTLDFGGLQTLNRVDLYPGQADRFPTSFVLEGSVDGESWTQLVKETNYVLAANSAAVLRFDTAQYRYLRLQVEATASGKLQLCEWEAYNDDGTMAAPLPLNGAVPVDKTLKPSDNLARAKGVKRIYSDNYQSPPYWQINFINDGVGYDAIASGNAGYSSQAKASATEGSWIGYDLGELKELNKVIVFNAWHDRGAKKAECYPSDYTIEVSKDNINWTTVFTAANDTNWEQVGARVLEFEPTIGRYVRLNAQRLSRCGDGFMLQLSELEVYGSDYVGEENIWRILLGETIKDALEEQKNLSPHLVTIIRERFEAALTKAQTVYADKNATDEALKEADDALIHIMQYLLFTADKSGLTAAIAHGKEVAASIEYLDDEMMQAYKEVLASAEATLDDPYSLDADYAEAIAALEEAESRLNRVNDLKLDALKYQIQKSEELDQSKYIDDAALADFREKLQAANDLLKDIADRKVAVTQAQVDKATTALHNARAALRLIPNKNALKELLDRANAEDLSQYTKESGAVLKLAIDLAKAVYDDPLADEDAVKAAQEVLHAAIKNLAPVKNSGGTEEPSDNPSGGKEPPTGEKTTAGTLLLTALLISGGCVMLLKSKRTKKNSQ